MASKRRATRRQRAPPAEVDPGWAALQPGGYQPEVVVEAQPEDAARRREPVEVWLHNDHYTPAESVVKVVAQVFALGWWKANWIMVKAHSTGLAIVGRYPCQEAEEKVARAEGRGALLRLHRRACAGASSG